MRIQIKTRNGRWVWPRLTWSGAISLAICAVAVVIVMVPNLMWVTGLGL